MRFLTARRLALAALLPALFVFSAVPGCSNESEGERCGDNPTNPSDPGTLNNDDCSAPLVCVEGRPSVAANLLLHELGESCRKILELFYFENLSMKEIVSQMHYENEQVVRNKKYKCLQQLTDKMKQNPLAAQQITELISK